MASTVIQGARVFDGESVHEKTDVLVVDGLIARVGQDLQPGPDAERVDGAGKTLLPGLIDAHTHAKPPALQMALTFGVTTELDMFSDPDFMTEQRAEAQVRNDMADVRTAMTGVTVEGGFANGFVGPFFDKPFPARVAEGADYIKVMVEDGTALGLQFPDLTEQAVKAVVDAAHRYGKMAVAHTMALHSALTAVRAGMDGLVHLFSDKEPTDDEVAEFAASGVFVVPTLSVLQSLHGHLCAAHLGDDKRAEPYLPADWKQNLNESWHVPAPGSFEIGKHVTRRFYEAGIDVLGGTDVCTPGVPGLAHGVSMHGELELLVEAGLTPVAALRASTYLNAKRFGLHDRGLIAPGKVADLLLVDGDPTTIIGDSLSIAGVWRRGERARRITAADPVA
jgi:imidazolonepropionase-like amidohydrolase